MINQLFYCFNPVFRVFFLIAPLVSLYVGILPIIGTTSEYIYYALPFTVLNIVSFSWSCDYRLSFFWDEVYNTTFCFPALQRLWLVVRNPFAKASTATRKGVKAETKNYNLHINWQLLILLLMSIFGIVIHFGGYALGMWSTEEFSFQGKQIMLFWIVYNSVVMTASILSGIDQPVRRQEDRFPVQKACKVYIGNDIYFGCTTNLSESGTSISLNSCLIDITYFTNQSVTVEFCDDNFFIEAKIIGSQSQQKYSKLAIKFENVTLLQNRYLVEMLYCNMNWWKQRKKPGFTDSLLALMTAIFTLRPIRNAYKSS